VAQRSDAAKQARWLELIRSWQRSHFTVREFCQRHQVSEASFFSWRRVLRERGLLEAKPSAFVKLMPRDAAPGDAPLEVIVHPRRRLIVRPGFDAQTLLQLVHLLEEPTC
jgi:transposase-like protein